MIPGDGGGRPSGSLAFPVLLRCKPPEIAGFPGQWPNAAKEPGTDPKKIASEPASRRDDEPPRNRRTRWKRVR